MKTVRVQGCLPTLALLLTLLAIAAVAVFFGGVAIAVGVGAALLFAAVRLVRRLLGLGGSVRPGPFGRPGPGGAGRGPGDGGAASGTVEVLPPGWVERDATGPVVDVPARPAEGRGESGAPEGSGERERLPRG